MNLLRRKFSLFILLLFMIVACSQKEEKITFESLIKGKERVEIFSDDFERRTLGENYSVQGGNWKILENRLVSTIAKNRNLVLSAVELPQNGVVELTMWSDSDDIDVKFNLWGDGKIHDHGDGYSFILGGWKNKISVISKLDEHEKNRVEKRNIKLEKGKKYRSKVVRISNKINWFVNDELFLTYNDENPLDAKSGFNRLSFGNWKSRVNFDDLKIFKFMGE